MPALPIYVARALRDFGDGFVAVLLPVYLIAIGMSEFQVGVVAALALFGSTLMTLAIARYGQRFPQRQLLIAASALMVATGLAFALSSAYAVILLIAFVGTVNPSSGSASIFIPMEHAVLAGAAPDQDRTRSFARYSLVGALAGALGALASGSPDLLAAFDVSRIHALKAMFVLYAALGVAGGIAYARIATQRADRQDVAASRLGPSKRIVYRLALLFSLDSLAGGFVVQSLLALWLFNKFSLSLASAGLFFFWTGVLSAFSFPVAARLARRIGLINTMVYTHIPSSLCLIAAALAPNLQLAMALLLVRAALSQMDVPTRSSYVMAVVTPAERAAAASVTSVPRNLAAAASPAVAGALFAAGYQAWPLVICGVLKIVYDVALLWTFRHIRPPEEQ